MSVEFRAYPKTPRLFRDIEITEKIDGTNAAVVIEPGSAATYADEYAAGSLGQVRIRGDLFTIWAQSRKRIITPEADNFGFAAWVHENAGELVKVLGVGTHYGEWYGKGIQRGYGLDHRRFALFNPERYAPAFLAAVDGLETVPVLYRGPFSETRIHRALDDLRALGSEAVHGFGNPEGIIVWHSASRNVFKVLLENDEKPKGALA